MSIKKKKVRYYQDELNDDFAISNGKLKPPKDLGKFKYIHTNFWWKIWAGFIRWTVPPIVHAFCKITYGYTIKNKRNIRKLKSGCFVYSNHVHTICDALACGPIMGNRKGFKIIVSRETLAIGKLRGLLTCLGILPLPLGLKETRSYLDALDYYAKKGQGILIYPEAHLWPYYNGIRNYADGSFDYPCRFNVPAVGAVTIFKKRKVFKFLPPRVITYIGKPEYPNQALSPLEARTDLRDRIYNFQVSTIAKFGSYEHIRYQKTEEKEG